MPRGLWMPGGLERFFLETGAQAPGDAAGAGQALAAAARHGWEFVAP